MGTGGLLSGQTWPGLGLEADVFGLVAQGRVGFSQHLDELSFVS